MNESRVLIIIPCYNEQESISVLLEEILRCQQGYKTIVIDDGSQDSTYRKAKQLAPTVKLLRNLGIGGAVQTGIKYAYRNGFDFCVQIDGDGQHLPCELSKLLQAYREKPRSIIIGSRYLHNDTFHSTWARRFGGRAIAETLSLLFPKCLVTDPTSGMRLMDRKAIGFFAKHYPHDFPEPISLAWALREGLSVGEAPVQMNARMHGNSSIIGLKPIIYMLRVLGYIILTRLIPTKLP
ncbi:glycosyltransferase family 2 protein [Solemya velesiana gill symbiont]|uniref:Glycosyltransferase n=1 Tax=Solemya velesiana gill symbiont TaxID=1918948 RepID=A0A1T2KV70_9GAMM|nr:glycosyltransferase family 2 protein [Solemya velesiana gill symbiont]OOZ36747.1 glycosyltransferase [Solemya velesiana gill symbiont]